MKHVLRFVILLFFSLGLSFSGFSQIDELVFIKLYPNVRLTHGIKKLPGNVGYASTLGFQSGNDEVVNVGVWSEYDIELVEENTNLTYLSQLITYDNDLNVVNNLPLNFVGNNGNLDFINVQLAYGNNFNTILYLGNNIPSSIYNYDYSSGVYTPLENFVSDEDRVQAFFLKYNPLNNSLFELMRYTESYEEPYPGYYKASYDQRALRTTAGQVFTVLNDTTLIAYLNLCGDQSLKTFEETMDFSSWNNQVNALRVEMNLNSGEINTNQIGSDAGNLTTFSLQPSNNSSHIFRTGLVRGNNTPISTSGSEIEMPTNDSLYHVFITKEDVSGNTQWFTELYAYNNSFSDTSSSAKFNVSNNFNMVESDDHLFISSIVKADASDNDTLYYRDFLGETSSFYDYIPVNLNVALPIEDYQIPFSESAIYKLDENGNVIAKISHSNLTAGYRIPLELSLPSYDETRRNLFKVGNRLAWVNYYYAANDSIGEFVYTLNNGNEFVANMEMTAGRGVFVLWLDLDLNIMDYTTYKYEYTSSQNSIFALNILTIMPYAEDTLLIEGILTKNISTNLDPNGETPDFITDEQYRFLAFYSTGEDTSVKKRNKSSFNIFPNPTRDIIQLSGVEDPNARFLIMDLTGRVIVNGKIEGAQINVANLNSGLYLLSIESKTGTNVQKFVIE